MRWDRRSPFSISSPHEESLVVYSSFPIMINRIQSFMPVAAQDMMFLNIKQNYYIFSNLENTASNFKDIFLNIRDLEIFIIRNVPHRIVSPLCYSIIIIITSWSAESYVRIARLQCKMCTGFLRTIRQLVTNRDGTIGNAKV